MVPQEPLHNINNLPLSNKLKEGTFAITQAWRQNTTPYVDTGIHV
jgi:hypothetical protein